MPTDIMSSSRLRTSVGHLRKRKNNENLLYGAGQGARMPRVQTPQDTLSQSKVWGDALKSGKKKSQVGCSVLFAGCLDFASSLIAKS